MRHDTQPARPMALETDSEIRYRDLDGDGCLDAVEVVDRVLCVDPTTGGRHVVHVVRTMAAGIEEDGLPRVVLSNSSRP